MSISSTHVVVATNLDKTGYTATTVSDKTGYTASTVSDKTGYTASTVSDKTGYTASTVSDKTNYSLSSSSAGVIKQIARGTITITNGNGTANLDISGLSLPSLTKVTLNYLGVNATSSGDEFGMLELTSTTNLRGQRNHTTDSTVIGYQIIEYN